jgi:hypothetical protein
MDGRRGAGHAFDATITLGATLELALINGRASSSHGQIHAATPNIRFRSCTRLGDHEWFFCLCSVGLATAPNASVIGAHTQKSRTVPAGESGGEAQTDDAGRALSLSSGHWAVAAFWVGRAAPRETMRWDGMSRWGVVGDDGPIPILAGRPPARPPRTGGSSDAGHALRRRRRRRHTQAPLRDAAAAEAAGG